jgi:hypothetical protein
MPPATCRRLPAVVVAVFLASQAGPAAAAACPAPTWAGPATALAAVNPDLRLAFVEDSLRQAARPARRWSWGWGLGLAVTGTVQLGVGIPPLLDDRGQRAELIVGGAKSMLGIVPLVATPLTVMSDARPLESPPVPPPPAADRCMLLAGAEERLARAAASEEFGKSWLRHVGTVALNLGAGLFLGLAYDRWLTAAVGAAVGIVVGEAIIYTQPTHSVDALARYRLLTDSQ